MTKITFTFLLTVCFIIPAYAAKKQTFDQLSNDVAALELGFDKYVLGKNLTDEQQSFAKKNLEPKSYKGTYKFKDGDVYVVASNKTNTIIGLYIENKEATKKQLKEMVGNLMMEFDEPTLMAHDKLIYWAYSKDGKLSEDELRENKEKKTDALTTIKFSSSDPILKKDEEKKESEELLHIYCIISSNPLSKKFMSQPI